MERQLAAREIFIKLVRNLQKCLNNIDSRIVDSVGNQKIILNGENMLLKMNLSNINYILELCHKLAIDPKGKCCSVIWLSRMAMDFSVSLWFKVYIT